MQDSLNLFGVDEEKAWPEARLITYDIAKTLNKVAQKSQWVHVRIEGNEAFGTRSVLEGLQIAQ